MDDIDKFTKKLKHDIAIRVLEELRNIRDGNIAHLDIKKVKGESSVYRVRLGTVRIKFVRTAHGNVILEAGFRNDHTY
jgi:mRNA-degrading endonuclease RelE of RelBE toxin-antitoxin system